MTRDALQGFATIPRSVLHDETLTAAAKMVYIVLSSHSSTSSAHVWPSHRTIARIAGLSVATVKRRLLELRDAGLIEWDTRIGSADMRVANEYRLVTGAAAQQNRVAHTEPPLAHSELPPAAAQQNQIAHSELPPDSSHGTTPESGKLTVTPSSQGATNENQSQPRTRSAGRRGSRIPDDWRRSSEDVDWQRRENIPDEFARPVTAEFRDYWQAAAGAKASKLDWSKAWRVWMSRDWNGQRGEAFRRRQPGAAPVRDFDAERRDQRVARRASAPIAGWQA